MLARGGRIASFEVVGLILVAAAVAASACGGGLSDDRDDAASRERRFRSLVGGSYSCDYQNVFFLAGPVIQPVRMTVRASQITALVTLESGSPVPRDLWGHFRTVEAVFQEIQTAARQGAAKVEVTYDERYSYPRETFIDLDARVVDEERRFLISNLQPEP